MSQSKIVELRKAFDFFDKTKSGTIRAEEIDSIFKSLGKSFTREEIQDLIHEADKNLNGSIDFDDFLAIMTNQVSKNDDEQELKEVFNIFDKDKTGLLNPNELEEAMKILGENVTQNELRKIIQTIDKNQDGLISFDEFKQFFSQ